MPRQRLTPQERREACILAALALGRSRPLDQVTAADVAERVGCSRPLVTHYFRSAAALRRCVMREAVKRGDLQVIGRSLASGGGLSSLAPADTRRAALKAFKP